MSRPLPERLDFFIYESKEYFTIVCNKKKYNAKKIKHSSKITGGN